MTTANATRLDLGTMTRLLPPTVIVVTANHLTRLMIRSIAETIPLMLWTEAQAHHSTRTLFPTLCSPTLSYLSVNMLR